MRCRTLLKKHRVLALPAAVWLLFFLTGLPCPLRWATGLPCPTCGVTRALLALARGDLRESLCCHPLALQLTLSAVIALYLRRMRPAAQKAAALLIGVTLLENTVFFLLRVAATI